MSDKPVTTDVNHELCIGCGLCLTVCPSDTLEIKDGKCHVTGPRSLGCGHCQAVCPTEAIRVQSLDPDNLALSTVKASGRWIKHGDFDTGALVDLMRSRRSCRNYKERPVPLELLHDLVKIGTSAPSGTNEQAWSFTVLPTREAVMKVGEATMTFFKKLNKMAGQAWLRGGLKLVGRPELAAYHAEYAERVAEAIVEYEKTGKERLFHGATAAILVGSCPGSSTPIEDALLAAQNILLAAHAQGLGTCLVGFVVEAAKNDKRVGVAAGIPADEKLHAVIALGWPREKYKRQVARPTPLVRVVE